MTTHDDIKGRIFALRRLGDVAIGEGRADRATRLYGRALQLARQVDSSSETARALARLAIAAGLRGDTGGTQRYLRECQRTRTELNLPDACLRLPRHLRQAISPSGLGPSC